MPDPVFRSFAVGAMIVVAVTVVAALTLLPAVLSLMGDRINWLTLPFIGRRDGSTGDGRLLGDDYPRRHRTARSSASSYRAVSSSPPPYRCSVSTSARWASAPCRRSSNPRHAFDVLNQEFSDGVLTADVVIDAPDVNARRRAGRYRQPDHGA